MLKEEFPLELDWFKKNNVHIDLGYLGFDKLYACKKAFLPEKATKKHTLTLEQKQDNQQMARQRVGIEHSIGGMKRYRILSHRLRVHDREGHDSTLEVCAGLWDYYLIA